MGMDVLDHLRPIVTYLNQWIGFSYAKMAKMVMHYAWNMVFTGAFGTTVALYSLPFSLFMWYNKLVWSYPYESLSYNLLLVSFIYLAFLMQCLSDCCKPFVSVNSTLHNGQQSLSFLMWVSLKKTSSSLSGLVFLFLIAKGNLDNSWLLFYDQTCALLGCFYLEVPETICLIDIVCSTCAKFLEGFSITFEQNFCIFKLVSPFLDSTVDV